MKTDLQKFFIAEQVRKAIKEETVRTMLDEKEAQAIDVAINIFNRLLPMIITALVVEYKN